MPNMYRFEYEDITFQNASTVTANGTALTVEGYRDLTIEITSTTATATRTVSFYGTGASGVLRPILGSSVTAAATSTTGSGELWAFDITGLRLVYMALTAISGDTVTVTGRAIS